MPIRINFLAEQHAAEDLRRRDPVKRVVWAASFLVALLVVWSVVLQARLMAASAAARDVEARYAQIRAQYQLVRTNHVMATNAQHRLAALDRLASERFLWANPLHALQYAIVNNIELTQLRGNHVFNITEGTPSITNSSGVVRGKPASARERIVLWLEARDYSEVPTDNFRIFQEALTNQPHFRTNLRRAELITRSPVQTAPGSSRPFVTFTLECEYPDRVR